MSFDEKVSIYSKDFLKCCLYLRNYEKSEIFFTKKLYSKMIATSQLLEDLLDFHGAKINRKWFFYRELAATIRHLSLAAYVQQHIINRLSYYKLETINSFPEQAQYTMDFFNSILIRIAPVILNEAESLGIEIPEEFFSPSDFPGVITSELLEADIDEDENLEIQSKYIAKISSEYLTLTKKFDQIFGFYSPYSTSEIKSLIPDKVNEGEISRFSILVHNLQSSFDSYVAHGGYHGSNKRLIILRAHISVSLHLLQIVERLLHYYERHLQDRGYKDTYKKVMEDLSFIVDKKFLLDRTINYALYFSNYFLSGGKEIAENLLNENMEKGRITVGIPEKLGFHSRPSLMVAKVVQFYGGEVEMHVGDSKFDAGSVLDIQWAGGKIQKENIKKVSFVGDIRALNDLKILAGVNYGENSMGKGVPLPKELDYLKE
ncbi:MAG: phosphotransferase [Deltaproteobacteria bacterium]|nr:MAG: phosphotransferase [Deltaproteobacteria bacterium]